LLVARTDQPQEYNARIFRDGNGNIRRLQVFSEPVDKQNAALEITGFPYLFEWDCLQRALYQILHKQQNPQLTDIVEKITDNGFVVEGLDIENDLPLFRTLDNKSLEKARKILTKENS
jgi:bifunctional N-acetylglucosamine-1-phosphate-uridyltransferase/glucosamine-1-phosphate-acetyltransferase GlmU-like protein